MSANESEWFSIVLKVVMTVAFKERLKDAVHFPLKN